jgi:hypothetical protein
MGRSAVDGHRPVIAGDVPIKLVMIVKPAHSISHRVMDLDRPGRIHRIGNADGEAAIAVQRFRLILEMVAGAIGHTGDIKEQGVIGAVRTGILDGDVAMDAMVRADEDQVEALCNVDDPILRDRDLGVEAGDVPVARGSGGNENKREKYRESERTGIRWTSASRDRQIDGSNSSLKCTLGVPQRVYSVGYCQLKLKFWLGWTPGSVPLS